MKNITQLLQLHQYPSQQTYGLQKVFEALFNTQSLGNAGLAINAGAAATWKMTNSAALVYVIGGQAYRKAAVTAQAVPSAISWTGVASTYNAGAFLITLDSSGTVTTIPSSVVSTTASQAAAVAGISWPQVPVGSVVIGAIVISTSTANTTFTAGTTALDAAGISVDYINVQGPFFPTVL